MFYKIKNTKRVTESERSNLFKLYRYKVAELSGDKDNDYMNARPLDFFEEKEKNRLAYVLEGGTVTADGFVENDQNPNSCMFPSYQKALECMNKDFLERHGRTKDEYTIAPHQTGWAIFINAHFYYHTLKAILENPTNNHYNTIKETLNQWGKELAMCSSFELKRLIQKLEEK